ncbi:hypothetical protein B0I35DRAFT_458922 [Stachybotrys elegans]|uniref:Uncharacterized protein n=1 Tax=Stachybotrys elegans TaxID=80388 RepID=A0A8K0WSR4_9HYPO|nr:hypothetical protein B0I35DRAFT_458922 [Stachybotrys elegans]
MDHDWATLGFFKQLIPEPREEGDTRIPVQGHTTSYLDSYITLFTSTISDPDKPRRYFRDVFPGIDGRRPEGRTVVDGPVSTKPVSMILSLVLADAMARARLAAHAVYLDDSNSTNATAVKLGEFSGNFTEIIEINNITQEAMGSALAIKFDVQRFGRGYGFQVAGRGTLTYAMIILLLHAAIVLVYLVNGYLSSAWDDLAALLALALTSREAPALGDAGAGVDRSSTWNMRLMRFMKRG